LIKKAAGGAITIRIAPNCGII